MRTFLISLLSCSVSMALVTLAYAAALPLLSKRYAAGWRYMVWLVIAACWAFPFRPRIGLSFLQTPEIPALSALSAAGAIPPMAGAGNVADVPASVPLWRAAAAVWILGAAGAALYHVWRHGRFLRLSRRWGEPVTDLQSLTILDGVRSELGIQTRIGLSVCRSVTSPMLTGFFRPAILLPPVKMEGEALSLILKHELIHYKRHDLWYKALILAATALHWFNPAVYLMAKSAAAQCELSCDALVLQGADFERRRRYGETIIGVVRNGAKLRTALSTNFYGGKRDMKNRISSILDTRRKKAGMAVLCAVLVAVVALGIAFSASNPPGGAGAGGLSEDIPALIGSIGETKAEALKNLGLEEGKDTETSDELPGGYILKEARTFDGEDFSLVINTGVSDGQVYGFLYMKDMTEDPESGYELAKKLYGDLSRVYGEPTTYPGLPNRLSDMPDYGELPKDDLSQYTDTWGAEDGISVTLQMNHVPDVGVRITVQYAAEGRR